MSGEKPDHKPEMVRIRLLEGLGTWERRPWGAAPASVPFNKVKAWEAARRAEWEAAQQAEGGPGGPPAA